MRIIISTLFAVIFFVSCGKENGNESIEPNSDKENQVSTIKIPEQVPLLDVDSVLPSGELNDPESNEPVAKEEPKVDGEMSAEIKELKEKALAGDASAQLFLGQSYQKGSGVEKDLDEAIKWLRKSAEQGNVYAPHILKKLEEE
ncbi:MAG: SEL1-like repeat protein [Verrucomicrobiales bacterium]